MHGIWITSNHLDIIFFQRQPARGISVATPARGESACCDD